MKKIWGIDKNIFGLIFTLIIVMLFAIVASFSFKSEKYSFGYCNVKTVCQGIGNENFCLGARKKVFDCKNPLNSSETYRMIEIKCALQANQLCRNSSIGEKWPSYAKFENKTCLEWSKEDSRIKLIKCNQIFPSAWDYENIR